MKTTPKKITISLIIVWAVFLMILFFMVSCKTKHKVTSREAVKQQTKSNQTANVLKENNVVSNIGTKISNTTFKIDSESIIKLTQANPESSITIENEKGEKLKVTGANVDISKKESTETKDDEIAVLGSSVDKSKTTQNTNTASETKTQTNKRDSDSDVKTTSTWLWISLIVIVGLYFWLDR